MSLRGADVVNSWLEADENKDTLHTLHYLHNYVSLTSRCKRKVKYIK